LETSRPASYRGHLMACFMIVLGILTPDPQTNTSSYANIAAYFSLALSPLVIPNSSPCSLLIEASETSFLTYPLFANFFFPPASFFKECQVLVPHLLNAPPRHGPRYTFAFVSLSFMFTTRIFSAPSPTPPFPPPHFRPPPPPPH